MRGRSLLRGAGSGWSTDRVIKNVLMVLEIVVAVAAFYMGTATLLRNRQVFAQPARSSPEKLETVSNVVLMDLVLAANVVAAWALYSERSWARWMSVAAGAVAIVALAVRPGGAGGRGWLAAGLALLGMAVVLLAVLLPGWG
jgi:hypothetical protein